MNRYFLYFIFYITGFSKVFALDNPQLTQIPEDCLAEKKWPCLVRAEEQVQNFNLTSQIKISFFKKSLIKFNQKESGEKTFELVKGQIILKSNSSNEIELNSVKLGKSDVYFISKVDEMIKVYCSKHSEFLSFDLSRNISSKKIEVEKSAFPTREKVVHFISLFISHEADLYKSVLADHEERLKEESYQQQIFLQRKIASEEQAKKNDAEARQKRLDENKRLKDLFFMRTFKQ